MNKRTRLWVNILVLALVIGGFIAARKLNQPIGPIIGVAFACVGILGLIGAFLLKSKIVAKGGAVWGHTAIGMLLIGLGSTALALLSLYEDVLSLGVQLALGLSSLLFVAGLVIESRARNVRKT